MPLENGARKDKVLATINKHETVLALLLNFCANGDDEDLRKAALAMQDGNKTAPQTSATPNKVVPISGPAAVENDVDLKVVCNCPMPVKQKGAGQACLLCGGDAYERHYVLDETPEGQRLLADVDAGKIKVPAVTVTAEQPVLPTEQEVARALDAAKLMVEKLNDAGAFLPVAPPTDFVIDTFVDEDRDA